MDYTFFGGIYRPVWRIETNAVTIDGREYGSSGVLVDTPSVSENNATLRVRTSVTNHLRSEVSAEIKHRVIDESGDEVTIFSTAGQIEPDGQRSFEITGEQLADPNLWSPENPYCYTLESTVTVDGSITDRVDSPLGIRWFETDDEGQIRVNGNPTELRGTNRHQDRPGKGNALTDSDHREDFDLITDLGVNFLRLAHYPQSETILQAADSEGIIVWEEIPIVNYVTPNSTHDKNCQRMLREMIHQHYNHPSIAIWGLMNEILLHLDKDLGEEKLDGSTEEVIEASVNLAKDLNTIAQKENPHRLTAMACHDNWGYEKHGFVDIPDVLGWNLYHGWYYGEPEHIGGALHEKLAARPAQPVILSEYGVGADPRLHSPKPTTWDFTEEYSSYYHETYINEFDSNGPSLAGTAQWNVFDFASDVRNDTVPDINQKGLMTHDRNPKNTYHLYKTWLANEPIVHIASRNWMIRSNVSEMADGTHLVKTYCNLPEVELFVNGKSEGVRQVEGEYTTDWHVSLAPGLNTIRARASKGEETVVEDELEIELRSVDVDTAGAFPKEGLSINVGSEREIVADESLWVPDRPYEPETSGWGAISGEQLSTLDRVYGTDLVPLYQHALVDIDAYRFDLPPGQYRIEARFCEIEHKKAGQRSISVLANGEVLAENIDPFATAGRCEPVTISSQIIVEEDGLTLQFEADTGVPILNAISITQS